MSGAEHLRAATGREGSAVLAVGAVNAIAATIATQAGFDAIWISGLEVSAALGLPDTNVTGSRDLADVVTAVRRSSALPIIVDADNAGATVDSAVRWSTDLHRAGAAAICLEDSAFPKCNSFRSDRTQMIAAPELVCEQLAAMREQTGPGLMLVARTEAVIAGLDLGDAVTRAQAYVTAGADAVLIHTRDRSGGQARAVATMWGGAAPLVIIPTACPHLHWKELADWGYRLVIYANHLTRASLTAIRTATEEFMRTGQFESAPGSHLSTVGELIQLAQPGATATM